MTTSFPTSWPIIRGENPWPILDRSAVLAAATSGALPDDTWAPLLAAMLALTKPKKAERDSLRAALSARAPGLVGFEKAVPLAKCYREAQAAGLDLAVFVMATLVLEPMKAAPEAMERLSPEEVFDLLSGCRTFEWRVDGKTLPAGMSRLRSLQRLTLLETTKLRSDAHVEELASLPARVFLTLAFEGKPDEMTPPAFLPPALDLLTKGGLGALAFETTGAPVRLALEDLRPLASWKHLETLSLRATTLARLRAGDFAALRGHAPTLRTLVLAEAPADDWRGAWPGLDVRVGSDWRPA